VMLDDLLASCADRPALTPPARSAPGARRRLRPGGARTVARLVPAVCLASPLARQPPLGDVVAVGLARVP
jgi:hypothetical protein